MPKLTRLFRRRHAELAEELQAHLRMAVRDRIARGEDPRQAELAARREFGNVPLIEDTTRDHWRFFPVERLARELRHALRAVRRSPGFTTAAVLTLGVGLAAATVMFSVLDAVVLRPLPYAAADRIVTVGEVIPFFGSKPQVVTLGEYQRWRDAGIFETSAVADTASYTLLGAGVPERVDGVE